MGEDGFELQRQRKQLESHEARVRSAKELALRKAKTCAVTQQKTNLVVHHLFDATTRPDLATLDENLLVITSVVHRNFHQWLGDRPCEPESFLDYVESNELTHFEGRTPRSHARQRRRLQTLIDRLETLQARYEDNQLPY